MMPLEGMEFRVDPGFRFGAKPSNKNTVKVTQAVRIWGIEYRQLTPPIRLVFFLIFRLRNVYLVHFGTLWMLNYFCTVI